MSAPAPLREMSIPELRKYEGQLFIRNNTPMKVTCHEKFGSIAIDFELEPMGAPDSIGFLPKEALDVRGLQRLWMKGDVTISTDPELENEILMLNQESVENVAAQRAKMQETLTQSVAHRDIVENWCLQCGDEKSQRGRVFQNQRDVKAGIPPLCSAHIRLAPQFVPTLVANDKGVEKWTFVPVTLGEPTK